MRDARASWNRRLIALVLTMLAAAYLVPLAIVILNSVRSVDDIIQTSTIGWPRAITFGNFTAAWSQYCIAEACVGIRPYMWNSLLLTIPATLASTLLGAIAGYAISLWRFRGDTWIFGLVTLGVFLPEQMKLLPWALVLRDIGLTNSIAGLVMIHIVQGMSFSTLFCRNYYVAIPPDLIKAARIDGAGFFRTFSRIILPVSPPILIVTVIWQFTGIYNEFLYGVTFTSGTHQPVTAALIALSANVANVPQYGVQSAAVLIAAAPTLLVYLFGGRWFVRGLTAGAVK